MKDKSNKALNLEYRRLVWLNMISPSFLLIMVVALIPSAMYVYKLTSTILVKLCEIPLSLCKALIEESNQFHIDMNKSYQELLRIMD